MSLQLSMSPRRQHETRERAERAIEVYFPPGLLYEVVEVRILGLTTFAVKAWNADGNKWLGYAWSPVEAEQCG